MGINAEYMGRLELCSSFIILTFIQL